MEENQSIEDKYRIKSDVEHILDRPGMYVGSTNTEVIKYNLFKPSDNKIVTVDGVGYNAALLKLIDEVLSNSVDEHRRKEAMFKITEIDVRVEKNGHIVITDNGGIPVKMHKVTNMYVPEMIFGLLRTSSNYDDTQQRDVVGTNGVGAKISNIFSTKFRVVTSDGKLRCDTTWHNNMRQKDDAVITTTQAHGTCVEFDIDLARFEVEELSLSTARIVQKRCIDAAAANPGLLIKFSTDMGDGKLDSEWQFMSFSEYVKLYIPTESYKHMLEFTSVSKKDNIVLIPNIGFNFGFVNGAICSQGTHIKKIETQVVDKILAILKDKDMELITEKDITNRLSIFVSATVYNPTYDSQTKEKLATKLDKHAFLLSKEFLASLEDSQIVADIVDYYQVKYAAEAKKQLKKLNGAIKATKTKKLIKCSSTSGDNELWLFEGNSAGGGFRNYRDTLTQSAYLLRGKVKNTFNLSKMQILDNVELREVIATLCLQFNSPKENLRNCPYKKIIICTDMDMDGHHICGLLIAFFAKHFPELFRAGMVYRALSPIVVAERKDEEKFFYTLEDFEKEKAQLKGWELIYTKGLGGLQDNHYEQMLRNQKLIKFTIEDLEDLKAIDVWFNKSSEQRKVILLADSNSNACNSLFEDEEKISELHELAEI